MANAARRPVSPLILSADERAYLERQVRRHRVARSLSERCRVILRCADGIPSKAHVRVGSLFQATASDTAHHKCPFIIRKRQRDKACKSSCKLNPLTESVHNRL